MIHLGQSTMSPAYDPAFKEFIGSELDRLAALAPNWDRYGAPAIDPQIIAAAKVFLRALPENIAYRPRVVPMSPGNLQFEWHHGPKVLELEFESPATIRFLQYDPEAKVEEEDTFRTSEIDRAVDLIQWFMNGTNSL
jgi:hypothetical protein